MKRKNTQKDWLQSAVRKPGRVRTYLLRKYGTKAFDRDGKIKVEYLRKAIATERRKSLRDALRLALVLKTRIKKRR